MGMTARHDDRQLEELLGAYALDACEPGEVEAVEEMLARRPDLADEAALLSKAAAWIGATEALAAPQTLRTSLLDAVNARRAAMLDPAAHCYAAAAARLDDTIAHFDRDDAGIVTPNGLTARELIVHLASQDSAFAEAVGAAPVPGITGTNIDDRTASFVERFGDRPLAEIHELWRASVAAVLAWAEDPASLGSHVSWLGYDLARDTVLVARSFETWIHRDDLRRVAGRPADPPPADEIHEMADFSARNTQLGLTMTGREHPEVTARIVLTGPGGGEWTVPMGAGTDLSAPLAVTLVADVVDWCLVAGERLDPSALVRTVEGDPALADDLVAAAPAFATL
jgi:uncharacterized protein (TIGR03083 family)